MISSVKLERIYNCLLSQSILDLFQDHDLKLQNSAVDNVFKIVIGHLS